MGEGKCSHKHTNHRAHYYKIFLNVVLLERPKLLASDYDRSSFCFKNGDFLLTLYLIDKSKYMQQTFQAQSYIETINGIQSSNL